MNAKLFVVAALGLAATGCVTIDKTSNALIADWNRRGSPPWAGFSDVKEFTYEGLAVKDYEYKRYVDFVRRGVSWGGFGAAAAAIGLNTAGTLVTSATKVLSGTAGAVTGTQAAFNKNVLFDQSITAFVAKMDELRTTKLAEITAKLAPTKIAQYSFAEAYRDVEEYGRLGTLDAAFSDVGKTAGQQQEVAQKQIDKAKGIKPLKSGLGD